MSFRLRGRSVVEQIEIDNAYREVHGCYPEYGRYIPPDFTIYDVLVKITLPSNDPNWQTKYIINIGDMLQDEEAITDLIFSMKDKPEAICFAAAEGYYDHHGIVNKINKFTTAHNLPFCSFEKAECPHFPPTTMKHSGNE